jgi:hypothetical protein
VLRGSESIPGIRRIQVYRRKSARALETSIYKDGINFSSTRHAIGGPPRNPFGLGINFSLGFDSVESTFRCPSSKFKNLGSGIDILILQPFEEEYIIFS